MEDTQPPLEPSNQQTRKSPSSISLMRFAGMGIQLGVAIGLGVLAGLEVDRFFELKQPIGTASLALLGLAAGMYQVLRALR